MSKLEQLQGKSKKFKIGEIELELKPLRLDDMNLFNVNENSTAKEQVKASKELISKTLKDAVPDATDEEINNIGMQYMETLMKAIMEVNGLDKKGGIPDAIKARHAQIKNIKQGK